MYSHGSNYKYIGIPIRTVKYLNSKDAALPKAFLDAKNVEIPLVYQYCQTKTPNDNTDTNVIGKATNFRVYDSVVVCDIELDPLHIMASQFNGVIDNYTVNISHTQDQLVFTLTRLIIYNKEFKAQRDEEIRLKAETDMKELEERRHEVLESIKDTDTTDKEPTEDEYYDNLLQ